MLLLSKCPSMVRASTPPLHGLCNSWILPLKNYGPSYLPSLRKLLDWTVNGRPYDEYRQPPNKVATLQLCSGNKCTIIQLFYLDCIPTSLLSFLSDPQITFVGVKVEEDAQKLGDDYGLAVCKTTDIGDLAISRGYGRFLLTFKRRLGLKDIAAEVARIWVEKPLNVIRSDWQLLCLGSSSPRIESTFLTMELFAFVVGKWLAWCKDLLINLEKHICFSLYVVTARGRTWNVSDLVEIIYLERVLRCF